MNNCTFEISVDDNSLTEFVRRLPACFSSSGEVIYKARNEVRKINACGRCLVVKRFRNGGLAKQLIQTLAMSKARRSYDNARRLLEAGIPTPCHVAWLECRNGLGLVCESYYVCEYSDMAAIADGLHEHDGFDRPLVEALAQFVAEIHRKGILHNDLNDTNIRFAVHDGGYRFSLIDLNRMRIYRRRLSVSECLYDTTRFSCLSDMYRHFIRCYLRSMAWDDSLYEKAIYIKGRHDRAWSRRKAFTRILKKIIGKHT